MSRGTLTHISTIALIVTLWAASYANQAGTQILASLGMGLGAVITVRSAVAAARASERRTTRVGGGEDR